MNTAGSFLRTPINPRRPSTLETLPVVLEQVISGLDGHTEKGPHPVGRAELRPDGKLWISIFDTNAGRHAVGFLQDDLLDVVLWNGTVRLR